MTPAPSGCVLHAVVLHRAAGVWSRRYYPNDLLARRPVKTLTGHIWAFYRAFQGGTGTSAGQDGSWPAGLASVVKTPRLRSLEGPELVRVVAGLGVGGHDGAAVEGGLENVTANQKNSAFSASGFLVPMIWPPKPTAIYRPCWTSGCRSSRRRCRWRSSALLDLDLYLRMLRKKCQRDPCRRRVGRSRTGAACRPFARLEIPRPGFSRAAAWLIAARMPGVRSVLDAQKTLSDELCGRTRTAFTAPSAIFSPYCLSMVGRCPHGDRIVR